MLQIKPKTKNTAADGGDYCKAYSDISTYFGEYFKSQGWAMDVLKIEPWHVAMDSTLAWGSAMVYWMTNTGHDETGCYTCHDWAKLKDFAATIENINGGWGNGEAPLNNNCNDESQDKPCNAQQYRINYFLEACEKLGLNPHEDEWNGLTLEDKMPCEKYYAGEDGAYCKTQFPKGICTNPETTLPAGYPFSTVNKVANLNDNNSASTFVVSSAALVTSAIAAMLF